MSYDNHPEHDTSAADNRVEIQSLREQLASANRVITEYRQENEAQAANIHELAERARIAEALNVQGKINFCRLRDAHDITSKHALWVTTNNDETEVVITQCKGELSVEIARLPNPNALYNEQSILLQAASFMVEHLTTVYYCIAWNKPMEELRIYHDPKDSNHFYTVTIGVKKKDGENE